ncbi:MAG: ATP-binding protein [Gammaproteobacteria bacterium]
MNRNQLKQLEYWLNKPNRKPLIIRGARQVGKSTLVRLFAEHQQCLLAEINLERYPDLAATFEQKDVNHIINTLEAIPGVNEIKPESLLFLDEIQSIPEVLPILRYFFEDMPQLPVITAGSLLEFVLSEHQFSMPVGRVEYLHMGPMTFTEFLDAIEETKLCSIIRNYTIGESIDPIIHQRLMTLLRTYFYVGGMPEAVNVYADTKRIKDVNEVHNAIIETYRDDFPKYIGSRNQGRIQRIFNFAARNVGKKVKYSHFSRDHQSAVIKTDIELLCLARVISKVVHSHCSGLPLQADSNEKIYKLIFLDIGLMNAISGLGWQNITQLQDGALINEGIMAEQFIGQHLQALLAESPNRELNYWLREGRSSNAEVDYVVALNGRVIPIEVKSGATGSLKSLHQFVGEKLVPSAVRFDASPPSTQTVHTKIEKAKKSIEVNYQLLSLPLYLVERLAHLM